jgi:hypothetical protein
MDSCVYHSERNVCVLWVGFAARMEANFEGLGSNAWKFA